MASVAESATGKVSCFLVTLRRSLMVAQIYETAECHGELNKMRVCHDFLGPRTVERHGPYILIT